MPNPFNAFLEDNPLAAYFSYQNQWGTPNARKYFQNQFSNIQNQYMGQLGQWAQAGGIGPDPRFTDFLQQKRWMQDYATADGRSQNTTAFNPFTQWLMR